MKDKKKVILVNGDISKWYEQVIFIVKEKRENKIPENLVLEAERIINEHISQKYNNKLEDNIQQTDIKYKKSNLKGKQKSKKNIKFYNNILNISIFFTFALICYLLYQIYI